MDFLKLNDATVEDGYTLPRIDILQKQSGYKIWSVLNLKDGYPQMSLKVEHRPYTCDMSCSAQFPCEIMLSLPAYMSTPRGTFQWKILVMGLKNGNAIFQRMMEWVLSDLENADPDEDDIIIGSTGEKMEKIMINYEKDVRALLKVLRNVDQNVDPKRPICLWCRWSSVDIF